MPLLPRNIPSPLIAIIVLCAVLVTGCSTVLSTEKLPDSNIPTSSKKAPENDSDAQLAIAAQVPDTDIFLFEIDRDEPGLIRKFLGNVTRRPGYDNQPRFISASNDFLFSSIADGSQSDVYQYQAGSSRIVQRTRTPLSEYSPTPAPDGGFSAVTVEADGSQRLWLFDRQGHYIERVRPDITGVGYHAFLNNVSGEDLVALFIVAEPIRLDVTETEAGGTWVGQTATVATDIGRSLHAIPISGDLSFVQHRANQPSMLSSWNSTTKQITPLIEMPAAVEDMTWLPDGRAVTVANGELLIWEAGLDHWQSVFNVRSWLPFATTRLAVNDDMTRLAIVMEVNQP